MQATSIRPVSRTVKNEARSEAHRPRVAWEVGLLGQAVARCMKGTRSVNDRKMAAAWPALVTKAMRVSWDLERVQAAPSVGPSQHRLASPKERGRLEGWGAPLQAGNIARGTLAVRCKALRLKM